MNKKNKMRLIAVAVIAMIGACLPGTVTAAAPAPVTPAAFEGRTIDLADGWDAGVFACDVGKTVTCFRTEAQLDKFLGAKPKPKLKAGAKAVCMTPTKLYDNTGFGGPLVSLTARGIWKNLSALAFDNKTSSFIIGACAATMAENMSGGGAWYPGATSGGSSASTMVAGWSNRITSIYIA